MNRRKFFRFLAGLAAALGLPIVARAKPYSFKTTIERGEYRGCPWAIHYHWSGAVWGKKHKTLIWEAKINGKLYVQRLEIFGSPAKSGILLEAAQDAMKETVKFLQGEKYAVRRARSLALSRAPS